MPHSFISNRFQFFSIKWLAVLVCSGWSVQLLASEPSVSEPLDEPVVIHERLVSDESVEVPPEPVPPSEYQSLDSLTPALIAEEILRLRDSLGEAPLSGRAAFQLLPLGNTEKKRSHSPAEMAFDEEGHFQTNEKDFVPQQREEDRRLLGQRLRGMASRPMFARPHYAPPTEVHMDHPLDLPPVPCEADHFAPYPVPTYVPVTRYIDPQAIPHLEPPRHMAHAEHAAETQINVLRETARQLEESAHHLECQEQFERADQIRELAQKLRMDAREQREHGSTQDLRAVRPVAVMEAPQVCGDQSQSAEVQETAAKPAFTPPQGYQR